MSASDSTHEASASMDLFDSAPSLEDLSVRGPAARGNAPSDPSLFSAQRFNQSQGQEERANEAHDQEEEEEEEELTTAEVIQRLKIAWMNEKFSPELLPHQSQIVNCVLDQIQQIQTNLAQVSATDCRLPLHKMELDRIRYMMAAYLRARLDKIQKFIFTLDLSADAAILSSEEKRFARNHRQTLEQHFGALSLKHMPGDFAQIDPKRADPKLPEPELSRVVFVQVERPVYGVFLEDDTLQDKGEDVDFELGEQHIVRYKAVAEFIKAGSLKLI